ncbi:MAG: hypothetical protein M3548_17925 [Actinomycetota bacterium]|nr:hypothetical protein [Actinomycetota bacterium]
MSWQEERRADQAAKAERARANMAAEAKERREDRAAEAGRARADVEAKLKARRAAKAARVKQGKARRAAVAAWVRGHMLDVLFVPVIVVPAVLAWSAMAAYGHSVFGPVGVLLPLFSEAAMWAFAMAVTVATRAGRATGWLKAGVWVFAAVAAVLNFVHGITTPGGVAAGVVMAVVSIGGVVVHQLVTAGPSRPRRTRAERAAARLERLAERRVRSVRCAAVRTAVADLANDGTARLVFRPGLVTLARHKVTRRARLVEAITPGLIPATVVDPLGDALADEVSVYLSGFPVGNGGNTPGTAQTGDDDGRSTVAVPASIAKRVPALLARVRAAVDTGKLPPRPTRKDVQRLLRCRAEVAVAVTNALHHTDNGGDGQEARV